VALVLGFIFWEFKLASEPLLPMPLFRNQVFSVSNAMAFVVGLTMMGSLIYLSYYLQLVVGYSPTMAGLAILPMMAGIMPASIISGKLISKIGKYRPFPIAGTALSVVGMFLLSRITLQTGAFERSVYMFILGVGLGMVMPVLTLAVQNALPLKDIGTGTSANLFFRNMGSSFGTAIFGAILTNRMSHYLAQANHGHTAGAATTNLTNLTKAQLEAQAGPSVAYTVLHSFVEAISVVFATAAVIMAIAFVLSLFLKQVSLRSVGSAPGGSSGEAPKGADGNADDELAELAAAPAMH
jgi:Na+/melibiose symporter-like transporter